MFTVKDPVRRNGMKKGLGAGPVQPPDTGGGLGWGQGSEGGSAWQVPGLWPPAQHPAPYMGTFRGLSSAPVLLCFLQGLVKSLVGG